MILLSMAVPFVWFPEIAQGKDSVALFSQYLGILALIAMAIVQVIATRFHFVEWVFGGLDRSYILHKWLGIAAMVLILLHDTIDAEMPGLGKQNLLEELAETLGEISLYGLLILVVITIATFIPYHLWRWTHRFMGAFFVAGAAHYLFILKPFKNGEPLGLYTSAFCVIGILAFSWRLLPEGMRPSHRYTVNRIEHTGTALAVNLKSEGRGLRYRPGQFAFASFIGAEPHPFTISTAPREDGSLRFTIAPLGDFTNRVHRSLETGAPVRIEGPFGHFERPRKGAQIWVAAGVGITPFLAWAEDIPDDADPAHLIYCVRTEQDAAHLDEIRALAAAKPSLTLHLHETAEKGRVTAQSILQDTGLDPVGARVAFCGPRQMRQTLIEDFAKLGVAGRRFQYEEFEIRTGIGLRKLAALLFERVSIPSNVKERISR